MSVRDFPTRPPDDDNLKRWLDRLGDRQNIDLMLPLTSVAADDEIAIFDASASAIRKATVADILDEAMESGTWTPVDASGAGITLTIIDAQYTKIGRYVDQGFAVTYPGTISGADSLIGGYPFTVGNVASNRPGFFGVATQVNGDKQAPLSNGGTMTCTVVDIVTSTAITNVQLTTATIYARVPYYV